MQGYSCSTSECKVIHKNTLAECILSKLEFEENVFDLLLSIHQGSYSVINLASKESRGEVSVLEESALRLEMQRTFNFSPKVKLH